jgi:hypothetical protein
VANYCAKTEKWYSHTPKGWENIWWPYNVDDIFLGVFVRVKSIDYPKNHDGKKHYIVLADANGIEITVSAAADIKKWIDTNNPVPYEDWLWIQYKGRREYRGRTQPIFEVFIYDWSEETSSV